MWPVFVRPFHVFLICFFILLSGCEQQEPIDIGFIGQLTGHHSDLGIYARNGVLLAVEEINMTGGIHGRPINLIIEDSKYDVDLMRLGHQKLLDHGVAAIIGPMTSSMAMAVVPQTNGAGIVTISPTAATSKLTGLDDHFFRVMSPSRAAILRLAEHAHDDLGLRNIAVVWDATNEPFCKEWHDTFQEYFSDKDGDIISVPFTPHALSSFSSLAKQISAANPDGILLAASSLDSANICQQLRKQGSTAQFLSTMWAMTDVFLRHAGSAAEGTIFSHWYNKDSSSEYSRTFQKAYQERFDEQPNYSSSFAFEAAQIVLTALQQNDDPRQLKETIEGIGEFQGTQGKIRFDKYGDPERISFLLIVKNGVFSPIQEINAY